MKENNMVALSRRHLISGLVGSVAALSVADATGAERTKISSTVNPVLGEGGIHHAAIRTRDWDRTLDFYRQVLGCHIRLAWREVLGTMDERLSAADAHRRDQRWAYLDVGDGTCIEVFEDNNFVPPRAGTTDPTNTDDSPCVHVGIRTSRLDHVWETARRFGASLGNGPTEYTLHSTSGQGPVKVRLCFIQGPSGEWIELIEGAP
jgi:catechol 2,3-dioxygenase-like lactoylglutathione lyase family enzyme